MPRKSGTRNTRILAIEVSNSTSRKPPTSELAEIGRQRRWHRPPRPLPAGARPHGHEDAGDERDVEQQLQGGRELDHGEVAAGIFEHHRLVHHGELEVRRRIVDGDARVLGQRHDDERDQRQPQRNAQAGVRQHEAGDDRELGGARDQRHA